MRNRRKQQGIALLISIFVLLLISVVAIALIVSSGTESALAGNYRSSTSVYYAALAGLEEARGRLLAKNANSFASTPPAGFLPSPGTALQIGDVRYVLNPGPTEAMSTLLATYPDNEYGNEFTAAPWNIVTTASIWNSSPLNAVPGPLYKWARINAVSEVSLNVDADGDTLADSTTPLYYDGAHFSNSPSAGPQVLEITSFATLPNGSQKLLQYLVAPIGINLNFPAALTLDGPIGTFASSKNSNFWVSGIDQQHGGHCPPAPSETPKPAIGATSSGDVGTVIAGIPPYQFSPTQYRYNQYVSSPPQPTNPSVGNISGTLNSAFQTVSSLDNASPPGLVQILSSMADQHVTGPATTLPDFGSSTRPVTTIVQGGPPDGGDLSLSNSVDGYGLLVVTGELTMDAHARWHGAILVIGRGVLKIPNLGNGEVDGAVLLARTRYPDYSMHLSLGHVTFDTLDPNNSNDGFWYNSCWVNSVIPSGSYKVLSFHEISQ